MYDKFEQIGLTKKQILALSLWHCDGMSHQEIADRFGVTRQAVTGLCQRAKEKIKKSGNSLNMRFYTEKRPKMLSFSEDGMVDESEIMGWF